MGFNIMRIILCLLLALCWMIHPGRAQELEIPTFCILPQDVVQDSIQQFRFNTNQIAVKWTYTEDGARKMLAFHEAHEGQKVRTVIGDFESPRGEIVKFHPMPAFTNYTAWKEGWLKHRTDKVFGVSEKAAKTIVAGLKKE